MKIKLIEIGSKACEFYSAYCENSLSCEGVCQTDYLVEVNGNKLDFEGKLIETSLPCPYYLKNLTRIVLEERLNISL